jgi:hypothetical protein
MPFQLPCVCSLIRGSDICGMFLEGILLKYNLKFISF